MSEYLRVRREAAAEMSVREILSSGWAIPGSSGIKRRMKSCEGGRRDLVIPGSPAGRSIRTDSTKGQSTSNKNVVIRASQRARNEC